MVKIEIKLPWPRENIFQITFGEFEKPAAEIVYQALLNYYRQQGWSPAPKYLTEAWKEIHLPEEQKS